MPSTKFLEKWHFYPIFLLEKWHFCGTFSLEKWHFPILYMLKRKIDKRIQDFYKETSKALLITGARQIGKTYSIRQFGTHFKSFIEVNFVEMPQAIEAFRTAGSSEDILLRLSALTGAPLIKNETLIFFDEVQLCPEIVTAIKFLVDEGSYRYILSGSLLGVELKDLRSEPVGYMGIMEMFPLDFEEFITNIGVKKTVINTLRKSWDELRAVDSIIHRKMMELFRLYLVVGGMPAAVSSYVETNNLQNVLLAQQDILQLYKRDITQYDPNNKLHIEEIFNLIPPELNSANKRFILKSLHDKARMRNMENSFLWLQRAGVALPVYNVEEPRIPLLLARSRNLFKLFQSDVGLLAAQYAEGIQLRIIQGEADINFGSVYENAVAQELVAHGVTPYYFNSKKRGELDFIIEQNGKVLPIEVKSGKDYTVHRALANIMECGEYDLPKAIIFNNNNLRQEGRLIYAPIYMVMFLERRNDAPTYYKVDLSILG